MKKVVSNNELKEVMDNAINLLCTTVSKTLGPTGNNILIDNSELSPFITNDGVTIAKNIESNDERVNAVLEIVKEASLKTNEIVGDGTTTTLVLLESIYKEGIKEIELGKNPIIIKKELNQALDIVIKELQKEKISPTEKDYQNIAITSANDKEIGLYLSNIYSKTNNKYSIQLKQSKNLNTYYELKQGYSIEINEISSLYFKTRKIIALEDVYIFILKGYLTDINQIANIINESENKNIVIFVEGLERNIKEEILAYFLTENKNIFIIELPEYALHKEKIENDIKVLSDCDIRNIDYETVDFNNSGKISNISITNEEININVDKNKAKKLIKELKEELKTTYDSYEKEFIENRLAKLENGIITIYVGGTTKTEIKEKLMRYEDCLCALDISKKGIIPGEGISLLKISESLDAKTSGEKILKIALTSPINKIIENTGQNINIKQQIIDSNFEKIYNFENSSLETIEQTTIKDPIEVVKTSLENAVSIASLLLTTSSIIINEDKTLENNVL